MRLPLCIKEAVRPLVNGSLSAGMLFIYMYIWPKLRTRKASSVSNYLHDVEPLRLVASGILLSVQGIF
jgi:hypothetical protein